MGSLLIPSGTLLPVVPTEGRKANLHRYSCPVLVSVSAYLGFDGTNYCTYYLCVAPLDV